MFYLLNIFSVFVFIQTFTLCLTENTTTLLPTNLTKDTKNNCQVSGSIKGSWILNEQHSDEQNCSISVEEGYSIKITIDKFFLESYDLTKVIIQPGASTISDSKEVNLVWNITKKELVFLTNKLDLLLIKNHELNTTETFEIKWEQYGNKSEPTQSTSTTESYPTPNPNSSTPYYYTTYLYGKLPNEFIKDALNFKTLLVSKAKIFCKDNNIDLKNEITIKNIDITLAIQCLYLWPNAEKCVEVHFAIPVIQNKPKQYELNYGHLEEIWNSISTDELQNAIGWTKYLTPNDNYNLSLWLMICLGLIFIAFMIVLCFQQFGVIKFTHRKEEVKEESPPYNTFNTNQFQETPQMFNDDVYRYEQMHAHTNPVFNYDDYSDDEKFNIQQNSTEISIR